MPANTPNVGVSTLFNPAAPSSVLIANMSVIGGVFTPGSDINRTYFPADTPVLFRTSDPAALTAIGTDATSTLYQTVNEIIGAGVDATVIAVVPNILATDTPAQVLAKVVGIPSAWTGAWALTKAQQETGVRPGLLIAPSFTALRPFGVTGVALAGCSGTGGGATITFLPAGATGNVVVTNGVFSVQMTSAGNYAPGTVVTATLTNCGASAAATVQTGNYANPVAAAFDTICNKLNIAVALCDAPSSSAAAAMTWAADFSTSMNIIATGQGVTISAAGVPTLFDSAASIAALIVTNDQNMGAPYYNPGNHAMPGILGPSRSVEFNPSDPSCEANTMLQAGVNVIVNTATNRISSSAPSGNTFWGFLNTYNDPDWRMINVIRTRKAILDALPDALLKYTGQNLGVALVTVIVQSIQEFLNELIALPVPALLPGATVTYDPNLNDPAGLRVGGLVLSANWAETPALLDLQIYTGGQPTSFTILSDQIQAALTQANVSGTLN